MITIIDYGSGNLKSIKNGFSRIGVEAYVSGDVREMEKADALILPGVGAFGNAMKNLKSYETTIHQHIESGKPFLGVCLGLQVLFTKSQESKEVEGLKVFEGDVLRFPDSLKEEGLKIPHMGWNNLQIQNECPILKGVGSEYMYFVHSYYVQPEDESIIAATVDYGVDVPAVVCQDNIFATQFHPEKSGTMGLQILKNFVKMIP
jgi:imidazole glycerol-phosphate synthase subunit HisH